MRFFLRLLFLVSLLTCITGLAFGHEIPSDVTAHLYVKPSGNKLQMIVRVPLSSMRDIEFPELPDGSLNVNELMPQLPNVATLWISQFIALYEGGRQLPKPRLAAMQISLPSDRSFVSFDDALAHVTGPRLQNDAHVFWDQVLLDVLFECPIASDQSAFSIHSRLAILAARVVTVLRFVERDGVRVYEFSGDPGRIPLDPGWYESAWQFVKLGFVHILDGIDHLLFLLCLAIPCRRARELIVVVTAFTIAHSVTLIASALGLAADALWFPPLVETLIAASIVYMALENIVSTGGTHPRWMVAFGFGLVHGFGFSFALRETLQFAGANLLVSLLAFNIGVEFGQIFALALMIPLLWLLFRFVVAERVGVIVLSALVAHTGWHWVTERAAELRRFSFEWPTIGAVVSSLRWLVLILVIAAVFRFAARRWLERPPEAVDVPEMKSAG